MRKFLLIVFLAISLVPFAAHADETQPPFLHDGVCNEFEYLQAALAAEGLHQPPDALLEMAHVLLSKPPCFLDRGWLSSWGAALDYEADPVKYANGRHAFLSFFRYEDYLTPEQREPLAVASYIALTESPRVRRYHFNVASAPLLSWWTRACDERGHETFVVGQVRIC